MLVAHFMPKIIVSEILMLQKYYLPFYLLTRFTKIRIINIVRITPWSVSSSHSLKLKLKIESQYIF